MIIIKPSISDNNNLSLRRVIESATSTLRKTYSPNPKALAHKAKVRNDLKRLIAEINNEIVGTVQYRIQDHKLHLLGLSVNKSHRKKGVAKALIMELTIIAQDNNAKVLCLYTVKETGNVDAFKKIGFKLISEKIDDYSTSDKFDTLHEVYMELKIDRKKHMKKIRLDR